ncbi:MAG: TIGR00730 family Rossman fold protein [bacterium]|nr:TIGR00730 family Rossman fold protein [bacterium]
MNICVFGSVNDVEKKYAQATAGLAKLIGENGHTLIYGGSDRGLLKVLANGVQRANGKVVGISVEFLKDHARKNADEMIITKDIKERKETLLKRADVIIVLVGGVGTLDEVTEILELKKHKMHQKLVVILNTDNFYEGLKIQLAKMDEEGFLPFSLKELVYFADTPEEAIGYIEKNHK